MNDALQFFQAAGGRERAPSGEQFVEHDAESKYVASRIRAATSRLFRGHVGNRAHDDTRAGYRLRVIVDGVRDVCG